MQIADEMAVLIHYKVANTEGEVLDSSEGDEPLAYIQGQGNIVPGLEQALLGKKAGDKVQITVAPEEGYGVHEPEKVQTVPRGAFDTETQIEPGMQFQAEGDDGEVIVTVTEVTDEEVTVDANHPLAGQTLHFEVEVVSVRPCTEEELAHGHIHGEGGHHH
ncbi:MAG TPA: peptidylprolyl isomerase [Polyangiales bacterium]|nr:peptidylprolyl isomerase [Polyangiales bacterium]